MPQEAISMYDTLTEINKQSVLSYMAFLIQEQRQIRKENIDDAFAKIQELIGDDNPWNSEEEMLAEMANDRREKMGLVK